MGALKDAARKGRGGDTRLGHLTNGDIVFPAERVDDRTKQVIHAFMKSQGIKDPGRFTVGDRANVRNPRTRLPQFEEGAADAGTAESGSGSGVGTGGPGDTPGSGTGAGAAPGGIQGGSAPGSVSSGTSSNTADAATGSTAPGIPGAPSPGVSGINQNTMDLGNPNGPTVSGDSMTGNDPSAGNPNTTQNDPALSALNNSIQSTVNNPFGALGMGINAGLGAIPGIGQAISIGNLAASLTGHQTLGQTAVGELQGAISPDQIGPAPAGMNDTGAGLPALGGGIGVDLNELLKNRLGGAQT